MTPTRLPMNESDLLRAVLDMARLFGWRAYHTHDSRHSEAGFPDLVMVRNGTRVIFAELKGSRGNLTEAQEAWIAALDRASRSTLNFRVYVWRPADLDSGAIERTLR